MLYDLTWLKAGNTFPPKCELERLKKYTDCRQLYEGNTQEVLLPYKQRINQIIARFDDVTSFQTELNYHKLITMKTGDLVCGEPPTITYGKIGEGIGGLAEETQLYSKLTSLVCDTSSLGDGVARIKRRKDNKNDFVVIDPSMWFPIVNREDPNEVFFHVLAWVETIESQNNFQDNVYFLNIQIHEKGSYIRRQYKLKKNEISQHVSQYDGEFQFVTYKILEQTLADEKIPTGLDDFAIVSFHNTHQSDTIYGQSDYDIVTPIIAELEVRYALESLILDKHTAPSMYAPISAMVAQPDGEWSLRPGAAFPVGEGEQAPGYITWDASLAANHEMITRLEKHLYSLSEMGAIINDDCFGASQGYEALKVRMTNARLKARRLTTQLTRPLKKLIALLSESGYTKISEQEINIFWNDGIPNDEKLETEIAVMKKEGGLFDTKTLLMEHFSKSEEEAEEIIERRDEENIESGTGGFYGGSGGLTDDGTEE